MSQASVSFAPVHLVRAMDREMGAAEESGALMQTADDVVYEGRYVHLNGKQLLNYGSCSYLGLELRDELKRGAIDAVTRFGTQFPFPRAMLQNPLYLELEAALSQITGGYPVIAASTSLGHISTLPVIVGTKDAVLIDMMAHASVHTAASLLRGMPVIPIHHSDLNELEDQLKVLSSQHQKVWYLLDGLYSMRGDFAPLAELVALMDKYPALHLYVDDAHSTTWTGRNGRGFALETLKDTSRVVVALSLNKAFAAGGGAMIFPTREMANLVRRSGGPMVFSGAVQPPLLGAAVASARLHLSPELAKLQAELMTRLELTVSEARRLNVPLGVESLNPVFFLRGGSTKNCFSMVNSLRERGACVCAAMFPIVPRGNAGVRFTITLHNTPDDIRTMVGWLADETERLGLVPKAPAAE
ncbi:MAG TPA: aminotransferase class I/II-fold pyridoxal phosphate-dependent enzyme [Polyangiaceae bacterium]|nr:aminotransferase class I/II-fold pyridoxal phosphate-dependent enzyme [Polyangiaceae bacterium]